MFTSKISHTIYWNIFIFLKIYYFNTTLFNVNLAIDSALLVLQYSAPTLSVKIRRSSLYDVIGYELLMVS